MIQATIPFTSDAFLARVRALPDGANIDACIQCGTCTASCPAAHVMAYGPRQVIAAIRAGNLKEVMNSDTAWACASCYMCTVRCPAGIPFTDVMYELKRFGIKNGDMPSRDANAVMAKSFADVVNTFGRNEEVALVRKFFMRLNPFKALGQIGLGLRLFKRGRLNLFPHKILGLDGLRKMLAAIKE